VKRATGYLTRVNLPALAANLAKQYGRKFAPHEASAWLAGSTSPFEPTMEFGVFFSLTDPNDLLEPDEILTVRAAPVPTGHRWREAVA
jgi:hypothetical protein